MDPTRMPFARELFAQWCRARGNRDEPATRPFTRDWQSLLEGAGLESALDAGDAERDARLIANDGWLELKFVRYKPHLIDRVILPLDAEPRWREAFGFRAPDRAESERIRSFDWQPELAFVADARLNVSFAELAAINSFLQPSGRERIAVPIKERSLELFGDEKRLDVLSSSSALFGEGRLTLEHLHCFVVAEPLGWKRGRVADGPIIVLENLATWSTYCAWDARAPAFSAIVYGGGKRFIDAVLSLRDLFEELDCRPQVLYFGDVDATGLRIPRLASARAERAGLGRVEADLWSYGALFRIAESAAFQSPASADSFVDEDCAWLGPLADAARRVLSAHQRLPQELLGWEFLRTAPARST